MALMGPLYQEDRALTPPARSYPIGTLSPDVQFLMPFLICSNNCCNLEELDRTITARLIILACPFFVQTLHVPNDIRILKLNEKLCTLINFGLLAQVACSDISRALNMDLM